MPTQSWQTVWALAVSLALPAFVPAEEPIATGDVRVQVQVTEDVAGVVPDSPPQPGGPATRRHSQSGGTIVVQLPNGETRTIHLPIQDSDIGLSFVESDVALLPKHLIGISLAEVPDSLRAHVTVPDGRGVMIAAIVTDGPAAKAGLQLHDILMKAGDQEIMSPIDLQKLIDASGTKPIKFTYLRKGAEQTVEVTPVKREELKLSDLSKPTPEGELVPRIPGAPHVLLGSPGMVGRRTLTLPYPGETLPAPQVEALTDSIRKLTEQVEQLQKSIHRLETREREAPADISGARES
ncbi:MAG: PDZ domain-containing protein [Planctomycetota bacterium]|nr:MAG: PDZ domain-containing protein [Planctomycetota bacterium]